MDRPLHQSPHPFMNDDDDDDDDDVIRYDDDDDSNTSDSEEENGLPLPLLLPRTRISLLDETTSRRIRQVRFLYRTLTFPIVPCQFVTMVSYLYFLGTAFLLQNNHNNNHNDPLVWRQWIIHVIDYIGWKWLSRQDDSNIHTTPSTTAATLEMADDAGDDASTTTPCAQPLHVYAYISIGMGIYLYHHHHRTLRSCCFTRRTNRRADAPQSPAEYMIPFTQQRYDQIVYSLVIVYICVGLSFVQSCRVSSSINSSMNIVPPYSSDDDFNWKDEESSSLSACQETCPYMIQALSIYISMIELTIVAYIVPMLSLPCLYFYLFRPGRSDPNSRPRFMLDPATFVRALNGDRTVYNIDRQSPSTMFDRFSTATHPFLFGNDNYHFTVDDDASSIHRITRRNDVGIASRRHRNRRKIRVQDIVCQFESVHLTKRKNSSTPSHNENDVYDLEVTTVPKSNDATATKNSSTNDVIVCSSPLECCICMNDFIFQQDDIESGNRPDVALHSSSNIVRTPICHHLFHQHCLQNWIVGGQWWDGGNAVDRNLTNHNDDESTVAVTVATPLLPQQQQQQRGSNRRPPVRARRTTCPLCRTKLYRPSEQPPTPPQRNYGSTF